MTRLVTSISLALLFGFHPQAQTHDKAFWRAITANQFHPPAGASLPALANELSDLLASPDPELRDEIAYSTLTSWIYQQKLLGAAEIRPLVAAWMTNLRSHIGSDGTDETFRRSFSALMLSVVIARDNDAAFLEPDDIRKILDTAIVYLDAEQDVRGYIPEKGWAHSVAHTSDLLKFLGRSRVITPADQQRILDACSKKLTTAPMVFVFGEDERMARAVLSIVKRADFDTDGFRAWVTRFTPKVPPAAALSVASLQAFQNLKNLWSKLEVILAINDARSPGESAALDAVRTALKTAF